MAAGRNTNIAMANRVLLNKNYSLILVMFFMSMICSVNCDAQVVINEEDAVSRMMKRYTENNHNTPMIRAWRIQIITTNDRASMEEALEEFEELYPKIKYSWQHNPPYYQVRIGAFEKKDDLEAFLLKLKADFPSSIPVQDDIDKKEIISFNE